jgi:YVTN family beta-propeller protein
VLDPEGAFFDVGAFPLAVVAAPEGDRVVLLLNGYREQGLQVVETRTGRILQTVPQPAAFLGLTFDAGGHRLYASGGNQDVIYRYDWTAGAARLLDSIVLAVKVPRRSGTRYPAGLAQSRDGQLLYVAENLADSLAVLDLESGTVLQRVPAGRYPYGVAVGPDGTVYASAWGGYEVRSWRPAGDRLEAAATIPAGRHPSALLLSADGSRLYVASASTDRISVVDTRGGRVVGELDDGVPNGPGEGSTPNALALSADGRRLFVAEGDNNAVAVFELAGDGGRLLGRIPVGWYPTALVARGDTLVVVNGKGRGSRANSVDGPSPDKGRMSGYTLNQISGTLSVLPTAGLDEAALSALSARVARANGWDGVAGRPGYPPFEHVIYIIKENRTYDQVFGDLRQGDGDTSLVFFPRADSPNHHALAERFGLFDRFFVNAEVSPDGHNWSTAAYTTDYLQKTVPQNYSDRGRTYDYEGTNRGVRPAPGEDAAEPANGYLWDLAKRRGITFRNFGEYVTGVGTGPIPAGYAGLKPFLEAHTDSTFPGFDTRIPDQRRADIWLRVLAQWEREGNMPALQIIRLPNDHTVGAKAGELSPRAYMADNDLALGRMIEGLSRGRFWKSTVVFVVEDDAQNGPDHVDSHRAPFLVISAYNRSRTWHRFTNTTDVIATIEEILSLDHLSQFDTFGRPLRGIFTPTADLAPYTALTPAVPLTDRNPAAGGPGARESERLDFRFEDLADEDAFNRALWLALKGTARPYPGPTTMTAPSWRRSGPP